MPPSFVSINSIILWNSGKNLLLLNIYLQTTPYYPPMLSAPRCTNISFANAYIKTAYNLQWHWSLSRARRCQTAPSSPSLSSTRPSSLCHSRRRYSYFYPLPPALARLCPALPSQFNLWSKYVGAELAEAVWDFSRGRAVGESRRAKVIAEWIFLHARVFRGRGGWYSVCQVCQPVERWGRLYRK